MRPRYSHAGRSWQRAILCAVTMLAACDGGDDAVAPQAGTFTLSAAQTAVAVLQGSGGETAIGIARTGGFIEPVYLAVSGAPAGLTATITPEATMAATATLIIKTAPSVSPGTFTLTIRGTAAGRVDQTTTATVSIVPNTGGDGNVTLDFASCPDSYKPTWFAYQDGSATWKQILATGDTYRFNVLTGKGGYAFVIRGLTSDVTTVFATQDELTASPIRVCGGPSVDTKRVSGIVRGLAASEVAFIGMGGYSEEPAVGPNATNYLLERTPLGRQDLIAYRRSDATRGVNDRAIIRRDQDIANDGTFADIDFESAESFEPASAALTVSGVGFGTPRYSMSYFGGSTCAYHALYDPPDGGTSFTMRGIPAVLQRPSDFHVVNVSTGDFSRSASEAFHTLADRVVALPPALEIPRISEPAGGHKRIQLAMTLSPEYQSAVTLGLYFQVAQASISATRGWLGGSAVTLALPDFSGVTGWSSLFLPPMGTRGNWSLSVNGSNGAADAGGLCTENARYISASAYGAW